MGSMFLMEWISISTFYFFSNNQQPIANNSNIFLYKQNTVYMHTELILIWNSLPEAEYFKRYFENLKTLRIVSNWYLNHKFNFSKKNRQWYLKFIMQVVVLYQWHTLSWQRAQIKTMFCYFNCLLFFISENILFA